MKENTVRYSKIRPLNLQSQLDLCRHEVRYGCGREDECFYAHSLIELKVWMLQQEQGEGCFPGPPGPSPRSGDEEQTSSRSVCVCVFHVPLCCVLAGITHDGIVQEAKKFWSANLVQATQVRLGCVCSPMGGGLNGLNRLLSLCDPFHPQISGSQRRFGPPNLNMMFVCGQCWRNGQHSVADKNRKYCTAKARHT